MTYRCTKTQKMQYPKKYLEYLSDWRKKQHPYFKYPGNFFNSLCKHEKQKHKDETGWDLINCDKIQQKNINWNFNDFLIQFSDGKGFKKNNGWDLEYYEPGVIIDKHHKIYPMIH
ncbi:hypothetical protein F1B92_08235, partial [Campylobacter sp. FMV-PI01]